MALQFTKATKRQSKLRMALIGPAGSGKTYTALSIAGALSGQRVAVIDTERGTASKYSDLFDFDVLELDTFAPAKYVEAIKAAEQSGEYDVLVIDSLSHAWMGKGGALEMVDNAGRGKGDGGKFGAWRDVTPEHNKMVDAILGSRMHVLVTMRSKMEYVMEKDDKGRATVRKVGLQPVQRDGMEYEFDVMGDLDTDNALIIGKTRCSALAGQVYRKAGADVADILKAWLSDGAPVVNERRNKMLRKIGELNTDTAELGDWFEFNGADKPLDDMDDAELADHGRALKLAIDMAKDRIAAHQAAQEAEPPL